MTDEVARLVELAGIQDEHVLVEGGIARIMAHAHGTLPFAILTAYRGFLSITENVKRNFELASKLRSLNLGYKKIYGSYIEDGGGKVSEASFFVIADENMSKQDFCAAMENLGAEYEQDSILIGTPDDGVQLVSTIDNDYVSPKSSKLKLGSFSPVRIGDYFSEWKGRPFVLKSIEEGYTQKPRRELGFMLGIAVQANRKKYQRNNIFTNSI